MCTQVSELTSGSKADTGASTGHERRLTLEEALSEATDQRIRECRSSISHRYLTLSINQTNDTLNDNERVWVYGGCIYLTLTTTR